MKHASATGSTGKTVWFLTECSTSFGHEFASKLLEQGHRTVLTAHNPEVLSGLAAKGEALVLKLDVTDQGQIDAAVKAAKEAFGNIDVLVNNAGISSLAAIEESEYEQMRRTFETNIFGLSRMIHAVLPAMCKRRKGFIVNFSSLDGLRSFPALWYYSATKCAVEGLSEALWQEVDPLGIKVLLVEPSGFRTDWAEGSGTESKRRIGDFSATAGASRSQVRTSSGKPPGDPVHTVQAIINAIEFTAPPYCLLLGNDAFEGAMAKLEDLRREFSAWESVSREADFPNEA